MSNVETPDAASRRAEARKAIAGHAPGPWRWEVRPNHHIVNLVSKWRQDEILRGKRWGMSGAMIEFVRNGLFEHIKEFMLPIKGREHHADWIQTIDHPDANLIALVADPEIGLEASWEQIDAFAAERDRLQEANRELRERYDAARDAVPAEGTLAERIQFLLDNYGKAYEVLEQERGDWERRCWQVHEQTGEQIAILEAERDQTMGLLATVCDIFRTYLRFWYPDTCQKHRTNVEANPLPECCVKIPEERR